MENMYDKQTNINKWAEREHEIALHETVQKWGEAVVPLLQDEAGNNHPKRQEFFQLLMESVESGNKDLARLIQEHESTMIESTRSWYSDTLGTLSPEMRQEMIQKRFMTLFKIYKAGSKI